MKCQPELKRGGWLASVRTERCCTSTVRERWPQLESWAPRVETDWEPGAAVTVGAQAIIDDDSLSRGARRDLTVTHSGLCASVRFGLSKGGEPEVGAWVKAMAGLVTVDCTGVDTSDITVVLGALASRPKVQSGLPVCVQPKV